MSDPTKLAEEIVTLADALASDKRMIGFLGDPRDVQECLTAPQRRLLAAALRLAEARFALDAHDDAEPIRHDDLGAWTAWCWERVVLHLRVVDAAVNYEQVREGK